MSALLLVMIVFASSGGGNKKNQQQRHSFSPEMLDFKPIRVTNSFTLKNSVKDVKYKGNINYIANSSQPNTISHKTLVTYQQGNTIYIIPKKVTFNTGNKNNLSAIDIRINF